MFATNQAKHYVLKEYALATCTCTREDINIGQGNRSLDTLVRTQKTQFKNCMIRNRILICHMCIY